MFGHLVLGCLRDGKPRHGYDVCTELRARSGQPINPGNVYRELSRLAVDGFIDAIEKSPDADPRRNPYRITAQGTHMFDVWLRSAASDDDDLPAWVSFIDRVPPGEVAGLLEQLQERLWSRSKALARTREECLERANLNGSRSRADAAAARALLELKLVTAILEFIDELRRGFQVPAPSRPDSAPRRTKR
jgi:DNA-binding PadR family transcriptional regulator